MQIADCFADALESSLGKRFVNMFILAVIAAITAFSCGRSGVSRSITVESPDGKNQTTVAFPATAGSAPTYAVARSGRAVIEPSAFKISLKGFGDVAVGAKLVESRKDDADQTFEMPWGKNRSVRYRYSRIQLRFESPGGIVWDLEVRAYDDGIAFRYVFPEQAKLSDFVLQSESTEFRLAGAPTLLLTTTDTLAWDHERLYTRTPLMFVPARSFIGLPMLAEWPDGTSAVLTEAALRDFAGMYLQRASGSGTPVLRTFLSPRLDRPDVAVIGRTPHKSPWRVIQLSDQAGQQIESDILVCLNEPPQGDFSWVRPGKTTWHWWNGTAEEGLPQKSLFTTFEYHRNYIDFCARHGIAYHAVVSDNRPWHKQTQVDFYPGPDTDITQPRPGLDLAKIIAYGKEKGVGIRLWVHWQPLVTRLEEAFTMYEAWGIQGLMVDFLNRDDQEMVNFCWRVLESAARHRLHIQFHGSYPPTGEQRTFPNLYNREGALNLEYTKWSMKCDPQHNVDVAFTRSLAGPTDYHLGGFRSVSKSDFEARVINPRVLGTRCHHLALYVIYDNPMPQVCDTPLAYEGQPGFDFIEAVPTAWDETRFLAGRPGEFIVVARRRGSDWYLGGIANDVPRRLTIPLAFLGEGNREIELFHDGSMDPEEPNAIRMENRPIAEGAPLEVDMATGGGFVAIIRPKSGFGAEQK
jgi:alpha-glucosidase